MNLLSEGIERDEIETINFMVHLPQYVQLEEDYAGTSRMIEVLSSVYEKHPARPGPGAPWSAPVPGNSTPPWTGTRS